jgi:hypothetical protein
MFDCCSRNDRGRNSLLGEGVWPNRLGHSIGERLCVVRPSHCLENFLPMDRNFGWGLNAQANFVAAHVDHRDDNVVANHDFLVALSG